MNRIDRVFAEAREAGRKVFVPFLVAGDPDLETTLRVARAIHAEAERAGVPIVLELGIPYSDPLADGPTIQSAYTRALDRGIRVSEILDAVRTLRREADFPIVAMVAYAIVFRRGVDAFFAEAQQAGFDGVVVPDLPVEESAAAHEWADRRDFKMIALAAPTTRDDRIDRIASTSTGFLYYISVTGITGERKSLPADLVQRVGRIAGRAKVPVAIGFGVSEPEQVAMLSQVADGVIVGSALVRRVATGDVDSVAEYVRALIEPLAKSEAESKGGGA
jgi:tryptophan synthase alpha chain